MSTDIIVPYSADLYFDISVAAAEVLRRLARCNLEIAMVNIFGAVQHLGTAICSTEDPCRGPPLLIGQMAIRPGIVICQVHHVLATHVAVVHTTGLIDGDLHGIVVVVIFTHVTSMETVRRLHDNAAIVAVEHEIVAYGGICVFRSSAIIACAPVV